MALLKKVGFSRFYFYPGSQKLPHLPEDDSVIPDLPKIKPKEPPFINPIDHLGNPALDSIHEVDVELLPEPEVEEDFPLEEKEEEVRQ